MSCEFLGGSLKLKGTLDKDIKKKKKSKKQSTDKKVKYASVSKIDATSDKEPTSSSMPREESKTPTTINVQQVKLITKTKAELAFERAIEKRNEERLLKRAEISHKERVENYNRQLDALTEYNDVPKVSWTK